MEGFGAIVGVAFVWLVFVLPANRVERQFRATVNAAFDKTVHRGG